MAHRWRRFALEVDWASAHVYVGDMSTSRLVIPLFEGRRGAAGLQPRSAGTGVWVDDVAVTPIERLSYSEAPLPAVAYRPERLLVHWEAPGPLPASRRGGSWPRAGRLEDVSDRHAWRGGHGAPRGLRGSAQRRLLPDEARLRSGGFFAALEDRCPAD